MAVGRLFSVSPNNADVVARVVKSSFRLDKPKFEFPTDPKNDGAFDESALKFIEECDRHIEIWLNLRGAQWIAHSKRSRSIYSVH